MAIYYDAGGDPVPGTGNVYQAVRVLAARRTVLVRGSTNVEDVEEISAETTRHNVFFLKYVPYTTFEQEGALIAVATLAFQIDSALDLPGVLGGLFVQDVDVNGLLTNGIEFTVAVPAVDPSAPGPVSTGVTISLMDLEFSQTWAQPIFDAQALLTANFG